MPLLRSVARQAPKAESRRMREYWVLESPRGLGLSTARFLYGRAFSSRRIARSLFPETQSIPESGSRSFDTDVSIFYMAESSFR